MAGAQVENSNWTFISKCWLSPQRFICLDLHYKPGNVLIYLQEVLWFLNAKATIDKHMEGGLYKVVPNFLLRDEYPELVLIPTIHNVEITETQCIPYILLNLSEEGIFLRKGEILRHLEKEDITVEEITTETMLQSENMEPIKLSCDIFSEKAFITSPADVDTHRKVKLQDAEVLDQYKKEFEELCEEYKDIFSKDSSDIGKTPLITMEIKTGDSPLGMSKAI